MASYINVKDEKVVMWALGYICKYTGTRNSVTKLIEGRGTLTLGNGDKFEGSFMAGHPVKGKYTYGNGSYVYVYYSYNSTTKKYNRTFSTERESFGYPPIRYTHNKKFSNGYYSGEMKDDMKHGLGTYRFDSGGCYSGGWYKGKLHGVVRTVYDNGNDDFAVYEDGERLATLQTYIAMKNRTEPKKETSSYRETISRSDDDDYDYPTEDSDDVEEESDFDRMKDDLYDKALHEINYGTKESAMDALKRLREYSDSDDYYFEDSLGHTIDIDEQIEEVEEWDDDEDEME